MLGPILGPISPHSIQMVGWQLQIHATEPWISFPNMSQDPRRQTYLCRAWSRLVGYIPCIGSERRRRGGVDRGVKGFEFLSEARERKLSSISSVPHPMSTNKDPLGPTKGHQTILQCWKLSSRWTPTPDSP